MHKFVVLALSLFMLGCSGKENEGSGVAPYQYYSPTPRPTATAFPTPLSTNATATPIPTPTPTPQPIVVNINYKYSLPRGMCMDHLEQVCDGYRNLLDIQIPDLIRDYPSCTFRKDSSNTYTLLCNQTCFSVLNPAPISCSNSYKRVYNCGPLASGTLTSSCYWFYPSL